MAFCQGADWKPRQGGTCGWCGTPLKGQRAWVCCKEHDVLYFQNHDWGRARIAVLQRDHSTCQHCGTTEGQMEVHHIEPRNGMGYRRGCWNHQDNLITLCVDCHVKTRCQRPESIRLQELGQKPLL